MLHSFLSTPNFYHLYIYILIGMLTAFLFSAFETYLHEKAHCLAVRKMVKQTPNFKEPLHIHIEMNNWKPLTSGVTRSNFLKFLSDNPTLYTRQIRIIARAGVLYTSMLYIFLISICIIGALTFQHYILGFGFGFFLMFLIISIVPFFMAKKEQSDKNLIKHPEIYKYTCPYSDN